MNHISYETFGAGPPLIFLHGLLGSKDNWKFIAKELQASFTCFLLDARNHGESFHSDTHRYTDLAHDVYTFMEQHDINKPIVIGHSMGGKTALKLQSDYKCCSHIVLVDILPVPYDDHHTFIFEAISSLDLSRFQSYSDIRTALNSVLSDPIIVQFLLKSIRKVAYEFSWNINTSVLAGYYSDISGTPDLNVIHCPTTCLYGERSSYINERNIEKAESYFDNITYVAVPNAGHWLQAENPKSTVKLLKQTLGITES